jgi:GNAT superfamily N-acetyltransferase
MRENVSIDILADKSALDRHQTTSRCLEIANSARFPTDYDDVYSHLFESDANTIVFALANDTLVAFAIFDCDGERSALYLHGIIVHNDYQGLGLSKRMIQTAIEHYGPSFLVARTHNPRMFETIAAFACNEQSFFPNLKGHVPDDIRKVVGQRDQTVGADEELIIKNLYPDEKVSQSTRNRYDTLFQKLGKHDAYVVVARIR